MIFVFYGYDDQIISKSWEKINRLGRERPSGRFPSCAESTQAAGKKRAVDKIGRFRQQSTPIVKMKQIMSKTFEKLSNIDVYDERLLWNFLAKRVRLC